MWGLRREKPLTWFGGVRGAWHEPCYPSLGMRNRMKKPKARARDRAVDGQGSVDMPQTPMAEPKEKPAQPASDGTPRAVFLRAVSERIAGDRKHGWGAADSMHVIGQLWLSENGDELPSVVAEFINDVVNPSAFRQKLEDANLLDRAPVKVKGPLAELAAMQAK